MLGQEQSIPLSRSFKMKPEAQQFLDHLPQDLEGLSERQKLMFAAACCERHFRDYASFAEASSWGNPTLIRHTINLAWKAASGESSAESADLFDQVLEVVPSSEDFSSPEADYAQNAGIMSAYLAKLLTVPATEEVLRIASLARDVADEKAQINEQIPAADPALEEKIDRSASMREELGSLRAFLRMTKAAGSPGDIERLRQSAAS
jgi:uncharacterized protein YjaG (DUF416 family)